MPGKKKTSLELMKEIRGTWAINPRTRVQEDERKNKKKRRQYGKNEIRQADRNVWPADFLLA